MAFQAAILLPLLLLAFLHSGRNGAESAEDVDVFSSALDISWALDDFQLIGTGAHRELSYSIDALLCASSISQPFHADNNYRWLSGCTVKLKQPLQSGLFADPYQLAMLAKSRGLAVPAVYGDIDLEGPEQSCSPTEVETIVETVMEPQGACGDALEGSAVLLRGTSRLAVHSRYPQARNNSEIQEPLWKWMVGSTVEHIVQHPTVTLLCGQAEQTLSPMKDRGATVIPEVRSVAVQAPGRPAGSGSGHRRLSSALRAAAERRRTVSSPSSSSSSSSAAAAAAQRSHASTPVSIVYPTNGSAGTPFSSPGVSGRRQPRLKVAVDVDEVLGSFVASLNRYYLAKHGEKYEVSDYFEYCFRKIWKCDQDLSNEIVHEFFGSHYFSDGIEPIPGAYEALLELSEDVDLEVVTSRQNVIQDETIEWIDKHFPGVFQDIHFGNHWAKEGKSMAKSEICKNIGAGVLIDDNPGYALECADAGIDVLLYDWNLSYPWSKTPCGPTHKRIERVTDWEHVKRALQVRAIIQ